MVKVKADGLAAGKGLRWPTIRGGGAGANPDHGGTGLWDAGNRVVIEEKLEWEEVTVLAITDGREFIVLLRPGS